MAPSTLALSDDPATLSWQVAIVAAANPLDGVRVLEAEGAGARLALLAEILDDQIALAEARLSS